MRTIAFCARFQEKTPWSFLPAQMPVEAEEVLKTMRPRSSCQNFGAFISSQRFLERSAGFGCEEVRAAHAADDHVVFETQSKFTGNINSRLVGKRHAGLQDGF